MKNYISLLVLALMVLVNGTAQAVGELVITAPTFDMTTLGTLVSAILAALAGVWVVRKIVKTMNRS